MTATQNAITARGMHPAQFRPTPKKGEAAPIVVPGETASNSLTNTLAAENMVTPVPIPQATSENELQVPGSPYVGSGGQQLVSTPTQVPASSLFQVGTNTPVNIGPARSEENIQLQAQLQAQKDAEIAALKKELAAQETALQELKELKTRQQQLELEKMLDLSGVEFETMDPAVAQEFKSKVGVPIVQQISKIMEQRDAAIKASLQEQAAAQKRYEEAMRESDVKRMYGMVNAAIVAAHPDGLGIISSDAFKTYLLTTPVEPGSNVAIDSVIRAQYNAGNAKYVIDKISEFKRNQPSLGSIASVGSVGVATTPESAVSKKLTDEELAVKKRELAAKFSRGEISRTEFSEARKELLKG